MSELITTSDHSRGLKSYYGDSANHQYARSPKLKARSGNEFLSLSRCAACYNHNASSKHWQGANGESSSSDEDSESEVDCESEAESSSSSSCSGLVVAVVTAPERPEAESVSHVCGNVECGEDGDGQEEKGNTSQSQEDKIRANGTRRFPLVKSFSLPSSFTPHLTPFSLMPRPPSIVSTLHLQVLSEKHDDDTSFTVRQHLFERERENREQSHGDEGRIYNLLPPHPHQWQQMGFLWQQRSHLALQQNQYHHHQQQQQQQQQQLYQYQQQLPQYFPPLTAQDQMLPALPPPLPLLHPPTLHTIPQAQHSPQTHLHALTPQPCWYCYPMHFPYTYWSHHSSGELPRW